MWIGGKEGGEIVGGDKRRRKEFGVVGKEKMSEKRRWGSCSVGAMNAGREGR